MCREVVYAPNLAVVQGQIEQWSEQPGVVESALFHGRGIGTRSPLRPILNQAIL